MKASMQHLVEEALRRALPREWVTNPMIVSEARFEANVRRVLVSAERNYGATGRWRSESDALPAEPEGQIADGSSR
jgi:hypothetical protein